MVLHPDDLAEGFDRFWLNIHRGVEAGAEGAVVEDADDRQRVAVLDAGGQVAFAGHGQHQLGPFFDDDLAGQGAAGGDGDVDMVLAADIRQPLDVAAAAADAFVDVAGDLDLAVEQLDAVGQQDQDAVRPDLLALGITRLLFMAMNDWRMLSLSIPSPRPMNSITGSRNLITTSRMKRVKRMSLPRAVVRTSRPVPSMATPERTATIMPTMWGRSGWILARPRLGTHQTRKISPTRIRQVSPMSETNSRLRGGVIVILLCVTICCISVGVAAEQRPFGNRTSGQEAGGIEPFFACQLQFFDHRLPLRQATSKTPLIGPQHRPGRPLPSPTRVRKILSSWSSRKV